MTIPTASSKCVNGVDVDRLLSTIGEAMSATPSLSKLTLRAETEWINGGHTRTKIHSSRGAGIDDASRATPFYLDIDEPLAQLGAHAGPNAVETLLAALGACLAASFVYNAALQEVKIKNLAIGLEGEIDLRGFLGISQRERSGYQCLRLTCRIRSESPRQKLEALWEQAQKHSAVLDIIRNPVPVVFELEA